MKTIQKLKLAVAVGQSVMMETDSDILSVHEQRGSICLWYMCDPSKHKSPNYFSVFGTGHDIMEISGERKYIGTVHMDNGLVWHIFEDR